MGKSRNPDLTYLPAEVLEATDNQVPAESAAIAVELVSPSNPENDWVGKVRDYPVMGIPLYLVVDARLKSVTLFSRPDGGKYHRREDADFGENLHIPNRSTSTWTPRRCCPTPERSPARHGFSAHGRGNQHAENGQVRGGAPA